MSANLDDGSMLSVGKVPVAHIAPPPGAIVISPPGASSLEGLLDALPVDLSQLPVRRGWPGPGQEWQWAAERRELMLDHWIATGRATRTADGRGVRLSFSAANVFSFLGGFGVRHAVVAWTNRRSRNTLRSRASPVGASAESDVAAIPAVGNGVGQG